MAFQEVHVSQFTSPTTPYSGCRHPDGFFATENHVFHCGYNDDNITVTPSPLPLAHCVGHDQRGTWQLFAYLDDASAANDEQELHASEASDSHPRLSQSSLATLEASVSSSVAEVDVTAPTNTGATEAPVAWLVLSSRDDNECVFTTSLSYRPLTPLVTIITPVSLDNQGETQGVLAWVGSADDSKLRCYIADNANALRQVELKEDVFSFDSPVMVMDALNSGERNHLIAVGCQDGTVRVISFQQESNESSLSFTNVTAHTILVDGPIMALHLSLQQDKTTHLVVGSMCGFVCRLEKKKDDGDWEGPWMVTQGLWDDSLDSEDAVLAVNMLSNEDIIALGTHSGQASVWQKRPAQDSYRLVWKCQLPYSIHGLSHASASITEQPVLLVTTRFTFHVFQRHVPKYCADTAKRRLQEMIAQRQTAFELLEIS